MPRKRPIPIRGVTYPSLSEAARRLGVTRGTIFQAIAGGWLDNVGLSKAAGKPGGRMKKRKEERQ